MELNEIKKTASWGDVATSINENFQKTSMEIESLKSSLKYFKGLKVAWKQKFPFHVSGIMPMLAIPIRE